MADSDEQKACGHSRHTAWWGQVVFSAIALAAHLTAIEDDLATKYDKWTASVQCISLGLACIALLAYRLREEQFVGKLFEGGIALIVLGIWAAGIPAIMNPDNKQAVNEFGGISNANLYFSVWSCLAIAVWVFGSYVTEKHLEQDLFAVDASVPLGKWYILCAASVVMTASSSRLFTSDLFGTCKGSSEDICMRIKFAISTGAVGTFFALVASLLGSRGMLKTYPEAGMAFILFAIYTAAIALVTFGGEKAPGREIGNLYFSTWIGFTLAAFLVSKSFQSVTRLMKGGGGEAEGEAEAEASEPKEEQQGEEADKKDEEAQQDPPEAPLEVTSDEKHEYQEA